MSEPEISRRCPYCGASVRARAFFCPQCGEELGPQHDPNAEAKTEPLFRVGQELAKDATEFAGDGLDSERSTAPTGIGELTAPPLESLEPKHIHGTYPAGHTQWDALGDVHGVEKLRKISGAVFDEASYDPSLRFVLVAAVLFVLFLVLLITSELIT